MDKTEEELFEEETQRMLEDALSELDNDDDENDNKDNSESEDNDDEEEEKESDEEQNEDDNENSGDGDEGKHQERNEKKLDFEPIEVEVAGVKVKIESKEDLLAYVKRGAESFKKEPEKLSTEKTIIEQGQLSAEDLKLIVDAKNGSKEAIAKIARLANVDILDVENEMADKYTQQKQYYEANEIDRVADEILADTELATTFQSMAKTLPHDFMEEITSNARDLKAFSNHIKSGIAQQVIPLAINMTIVNGGKFIDNYNKVGMDLTIKQQNKAPEQKRETSEREKEMRKRASSGGGHNHQQKQNSTADIWNMSDDEFDKLDLSQIK